MATVRNKNKLAALCNKNCEEDLRFNLAHRSNVIRSQEGYITQVSKKNKGRIKNKLTQKFSSTERRILGALSRPDAFLMNPLSQGHSRTATETS